MKNQYIKSHRVSLFDDRKKRKASREDWLKFLVNIGIWLIFTCILFVVIEILNQDDVEQARLFILEKKEIAFINLLVLLFVTSPSLLFKRTHFVALLLGLAVTSIAGMSAIVLGFRGMPLIWSDIHVVGEGLAVAGQYATSELVGMVFGVCLLMVIILVISFLVHYKSYQIKPIVRVLVWLLISGSLFGGIRQMTNQGVIQPILWDVAMSYRQNGFVYSFGHSYLETFRSKPEGYSEEAIHTITGAFEEVVSTGATPNVIVVQLEAVIDPYIIEGVNYSEDVLKTFREIGEVYTSGLLHVPTIGGGTVRTEFELLTGMNLDFLPQGEIPHNSGILKRDTLENLGHIFREEGYSTTAMHNYQGNFYNRNEVFETLGFDTFIPMESMINVEKINDVWPKDDVLFEYIKEVMEEGDERDFIYAIGVSSHGPYEGNGIPENKIEISGNIDEESKKELEVYTSLLKEVDKFVEELLNYIKAHEQHTVLVIYSDHYPALKVVDEMDGEEKFWAPYVIFDNRQDLDGKIPERIETYELGTYLLDFYGIEGGVMNKYQRSYRGQENYLEGLELVQYDLLFGKEYSELEMGSYTNEQIQLGMGDLSLERITRQEDKTLMQGEGFNQTSMIYVDGEAVETTYINQYRLSTPTIVQGGQKVVVKQIGRNNVPLLETNHQVVY